MRKGQITLKDIAKMVGVSVPTVSRALKDYPDISEKTKKAIKELAEKYNYQPNQFALNLRKNKSNIIGVMVPEIVHHFFSTVISGIIEVADREGYSVMLFQTNESFKKEMREAKVMLNSRVDGLLISLANETTQFDHLREFTERGVPVVLFDKVGEGLEVSKVVVDDFTGAYNATTHLIKQRCKQIAHLRGPKNPINAIERFNGYKKALEDHGIPFNEDLIRICVGNTHEEGYESTIELLKLPNPPDAIFTITDVVAIGAMQAIKKTGLKIPNDVAVIGFSDWRMAAAVEPPLSSVKQPGYEMGKESARLLFESIRATEDNRVIDPITIVLKTEVVARESSLKNPQD